MIASRSLPMRLARYAASSLVTFACWLLWAVLATVLVAQIYVATHDEVTVPDFVLRGLEARLAEHGLHATFARATFDPRGRVLVHAPQLYVEGYAEPVVTARAAYVDVDPWMLVIGRVDARQVRVLEGTLQVPAMLSPSGHADPIVEDLDALIIPGNRIVHLEHVSGRIATLGVSIHGDVRRESGGKGADIAAGMRQRFGEFCRIATRTVAELEAFEQPHLDLELEPAASGTVITATFAASSAHVDTPVKVALRRVVVSSRFPILNRGTALADIALQVDEADLPRGTQVRRLRAKIGGRFSLSDRKFEPVAVEATADAVRTPEAEVSALSAIGRSTGERRWHMDATGWVLGSTLDASVDADFGARVAEIEVRGSVSPEVLTVLRGHTRVDVRQFFTFESAEVLRSHITLGPDWKFKDLTAFGALRGIDAHGVRLDEGWADVHLDRERLYAPDAFVRLGPNFARGSYEQLLATKEFRFLLEGQLRPMAIAGWFREWWPRFFSRVEFPSQPPAASVDVRGTWGQGRKTSVFVFADAADAVLLSQKVSHVRTRMFIRPGFYDGLELVVADPEKHTAHGVFTVTSNLDTGKWRQIDVAAESNVRFEVAAGIAQHLGHTLLVPYSAENPPHVTIRGHFDGPDFTPHRHETLDLTAETSGGFGYYGLPLQDVTFTTKLRDDVLTVDAERAKFAGGNVRLHGKAWGEEPGRRLGFDLSVNDASFGVAIAAIQKFTATRKGLPPPKPGKFVQEKANVRADLTASAEGLYGDMLSFRGSGNAMLRGAEIGSVPLFGPLSELLKFSELRFTTAQASFKIAEKKIEFPSVTLRGANSAVDAHGDYLLDRRQLDFRAKVFPFQESDSMLKTVVGAVLSPISNALEVKLTGTLEKPDWAFVIGPTNLLRSLAPDQPAANEATGKKADEPGKSATAAAKAPQPTPPETNSAEPKTE